MSNEHEIAAVERDLKANRLAREQSAALARLEQNTDFQNLIKQAYFRDEAVRLVHLRSDPSADVDGIDKQMDAIAGLSGFFRMVRQKGELADKAIADGESMLVQLHSEGA
jgi:hypothetical protein